MNHTLVALVAGLLGACFGSFLNVCIVRLPVKESVVSPPSRCPRCGRGIPWHENIPVIGWLRLRGRCAGCGLPISPLYPLVELSVAITWALVFWWMGAGLDALRLAVFATVMIGIAVTDLRTYTIPDGFTVFGLFWVLATSLAGVFLGGDTMFATPMVALLGACTGAGAIAIAMWLGEWALGRDAMGFGDVTMMAVIGAAVGPSRSLLTVFLGALLGVVVFLAVVLPLSMRRANGPASTDAPDSERGDASVPSSPAGALPLVPFGVFLAPAGLMTLLWGDAIMGWYTRFIAQ